MAAVKPHFGKFLNYDEEGKLVTEYVPPVTVQHLKEIIPSALALPYKPRKNDNGEYFPGEEILEGLTNAEVIGYRRVLAAASGTDPDSLANSKFVYEYTIGKPNQNITQQTVTMTYSDLLYQWAQEDAQKTPEQIAAEKVDAEQWEVKIIDVQKKKEHTLATNVEVITMIDVSEYNV